MSSEKILIKKASGGTEAFDIEKLKLSLIRARASKNAIETVSRHVLQELEEGMTTQEIYHHAFSLLHTYERRAALKYSLQRAMLDLGPSGFPFEKLVAEIFKQQGYSTLTDQIVKGVCVDHEVDVVAWKPENLIMCEAKYHSQPGLKSDLKIVLYVKARFDDLSKSLYTYGTEPQSLTDAWLVTNTKFTSSAIKYAGCQGLKVIGWNYPLDNNLHDLIDNANLHPLTSLHSLSMHDKKTLLDQGYVLCTTLAEKPEILKNLGLSEANQEAVLEEVKIIMEPSLLQSEHEPVAG